MYAITSTKDSSCCFSLLIIPFLTGSVRNARPKDNINPGIAMRIKTICQGWRVKPKKTIGSV